MIYFVICMFISCSIYDISMYDCNLSLAWRGFLFLFFCLKNERKWHLFYLSYWDILQDQLDLEFETAMG